MLRQILTSIFNFPFHRFILSLYLWTSRVEVFWQSCCVSCSWWERHGDALPVLPPSEDGEGEPDTLWRAFRLRQHHSGVPGLRWTRGKTFNCVNLRPDPQPWAALKHGSPSRFWHAQVTTSLPPTSPEPSWSTSPTWCSAGLLISLSLRWEKTFFPPS